MKLHGTLYVVEGWVLGFVILGVALLGARENLRESWRALEDWWLNNRHRSL